jgi:hypothetical protein
MRVAVGRGREACIDRRVIAAREPLHAGHQFKLVYANWILGDIGAADRAADRALHLWPKHPGVWLARLWTLAFTGRAERALAHVENASVRPDFPPPLVALLRSAMMALATRRPADVSAVVQSVLSSLAHGPGLSVNAVLILNGLGEIDRAFDVTSAYLLERGPLVANLRWGPGQFPVNDQRRRKTSMLFVPVSAQMRGDPRFLELTRLTGMESYWERSGIVPDFLKR